MAAFVLNDTMDALASKLETASVTPKVYEYPAESVTVPCAVIGYPRQIDFDETFGRGSDKAVLPVYFLAGKADAKAARDVLSDIITGATGVKDALDGSLTVGSNTASVRVTDCQIEEIQVGSVAYLAATFTVEVIA